MGKKPNEPRSFNGLSILAEINQRFAAVTAEKVVSPEEKFGEKDHLVVVASDDLKRFYTVRAKLHQEALDLAHELGEKVRNNELSGTEARRTMDQFVEMTEIIDKIFWADVRYQHPDLASKPSIGIREGWQLCWSDVEESDISPAHAIMIGIGTGLKEISGLGEEIFGRTSRRR